MKTHTCIGCNKDKPLSDYYVYPNGHHYTRCIKCQKAYTHSVTRKGSMPHEHELLCLAYLHSFGIPAMEGKYIKHPDYKHIDLVAFGCIRIEVKQANTENKIWFSVRQRENFRSDVVIVRTVENTYHIFPPDFHEFIRKSKGRRYVSVKLSSVGLLINQDNIEFIHDVLATKQEELMSGNLEPEYTEDIAVNDVKELVLVPNKLTDKEPAKMQLPLFAF
jgi:hypothetical protein